MRFVPRYPDLFPLFQQPAAVDSKAAIRRQALPAARVCRPAVPKYLVQRQLEREWMGIEPTRDCGCSLSLVLKTRGPTRRPVTPA